MSAPIFRWSEHTCGEACWHARDDVCHCSCGGKNHGCLRSPSGIQPARTARIDGVMRTLAAVGDVNGDAMRLNKEAGEFYWRIAHTAKDMPHVPAKSKLATMSQVEKWPELAAYRRKPEDTPWTYHRPYLLWVISSSERSGT